MDNVINLDLLTSYDALIKNYIDSKNNTEIPSATASATSLDSNQEATASVTVVDNTYVFSFGIPKGVAGNDGKDGTDGVTPSITVTASVDNSTGTPSVVVTKSGTDAAPTFNFAFSGLKGADAEGGSSDVTLSTTIVTGIDSSCLIMPNIWQVDASDWVDEGLTSGSSYINFSKTLSLATYNSSTQETSTEEYNISMDIPYVSNSTAGVMSAAHYKAIASLITQMSETGANRAVIPAVVNNSYKYTDSDDGYMKTTVSEGYVFNTETGEFESYSSDSDNTIYPQIPYATSSSGGAMSASDKAKIDYYNGYNTVNTVESIPVDKRLVVASIDTSTALTYANSLTDGQELHVIINNTGSDEIFVSLPNTSKEVTIEAGEYGEVNVLYINGSYYIQTT